MREKKTISAKGLSFAGSTGNPNRHQHSSVRELSLLSLLSLSLSLSLSIYIYISFSLSPLICFLCARLPRPSIKQKREVKTINALH